MVKSCCICKIGTFFALLFKAIYFERSIMNELNILKKHLGEVQGKSCFEAMQICSQINDANDFIGALQVLDLSLKKTHANIKTLCEIKDENLLTNTSLLIQNCSFMGIALFNNVFNVYVGQKLFEFEIVDPLLMLEKSGYEGVLAYIEDKREEIANILKDLALAISSNLTLENCGIYSETMDFKTLFK